MSTAKIPEGVPPPHTPGERYVRIRNAIVVGCFRRGTRSLGLKLYCARTEIVLSVF